MNHVRQFGPGFVHEGCRGCTPSPRRLTSSGSAAFAVEAIDHHAAETRNCHQRQSANATSKAAMASSFAPSSQRWTHCGRSLRRVRAPTCRARSSLECPQAGQCRFAAPPAIHCRRNVVKFESNWNAKPPAAAYIVLQERARLGPVKMQKAIRQRGYWPAAAGTTPSPPIAPRSGGRAHVGMR